MSVATETRTVVVERDFAHAPEKLWRALTTPHLIEAWLMKNDFVPALGHRFKLAGDWGSVDCEVTEIEPHKALTYTWTAMGMGTVVSFELTPTGAGTHLKVAQSGFPTEPSTDRYFNGAQYGWTAFTTKLDEVLAGLD
ncbi:SRPBCC domain-containing protein [Phenylobacterium sp.]|uniref:SRPBCC family protein n=1 Tax=Phenylobacterium sp. TaxID=1871053 RepID=UPI002C22A834|nr:SRPBCC domain-containing protein [Phenylobacterium sp.]HLZ73508.1 SRPBCC domain-containing protein [Phenylobacterium sp.]